ncbi:hypothetical protein [Lentilactobacillus kribbianus]|uniref:hypothetical protein n=1 Tax=Lentilactobacillus kribbianus TaxID=2729622 RepID=UPI0015563C7E|nr:hypothetical protein [Lentilactobacillus kribbianus]
MPLIAIIIDFITLGFYFLQLRTLTPSMFVLGIIVQILAVLFLLALVFIYQGQRRSNWHPEGYHYLTIRYGIIIISFIFNAIALFLYILNFTGDNDIVFSGFSQALPLLLIA